MTLKSLKVISILSTLASSQSTFAQEMDNTQCSVNNILNSEITDSSKFFPIEGGSENVKLCNVDGLFGYYDQGGSFINITLGHNHEIRNINYEGSVRIYNPDRKTFYLITDSGLKSLIERL